MPFFPSSDLHFPAKRCKLTQFFYFFVFLKWCLNWELLESSLNLLFISSRLLRDCLWSLWNIHPWRSLSVASTKIYQKCLLGFGPAWDKQADLSGLPLAPFLQLDEYPAPPHSRSPASVFYWPTVPWKGQITADTCLLLYFHQRMCCP